MSTIARVGTSSLLESAAAGSAAVHTALAELGGASPAVALVFASSDHDQERLLAAIGAAIPGVPVVGCSGEGVIAGDDSTEVLAAVAVMLIASDRIRFRTFLIDDYGVDSVAAGARLAAEVNAAGADARCLCVMPDGLVGNCTALLESLRAGLDQPLPIVGGAAADAMTFERTHQYGAGRVVSGAVAALLILGPVDVELAVSHGCTALGSNCEVTKADGGWIREIDGLPAWTMFKEYLADDCDDLNADGIVHLCIGEHLRTQVDGYDPYVIRTPLQLDKPTGALFFPGGGLTEGGTIQLTRRDPDKTRASAHECATRVRDSHPGRVPDLTLQFDCAGRGRILWGVGACDEIVKPLRRVLGTAVPWIGFHTYGEIAPIGDQPYYHNYTVVLCALYEQPPS